MAYGTVKVDTIIFDQGGADQNVTVSGIYRAITSGVTVSGTISGAVLIGTTTVSGATVTGTAVQGTTVQGVSGTFTSLTGTTTTGTTANFVSGVFTTRISGTTVTGDTGQFTSGTFVSLTGTTITGTTINAVTVSSTTGTFGSITGTTITGTTINGATVNSTTGNFTSLTGVTVTGTTAQFASGVFITQVSGLTVTGTQSSFTSGNFVTLSGATATFTSGVIASGTATNPSLSIVGDGNTGIYSPGADQLAVATNGTGRLFVDATGNVGVGTASPTSFGAGAVMQSIVGTTSYGGYLGFTNNVAVQLWADETGLAGYMGTRTNHPLIATTNNIEKLRITSAGNVGIGTSSPSAALDVVGSMELGTKGASNTTTYLDITTDTTYTDYGFRIIRGGAANGNTQLISRGTGALELNCVDGGYLGFSTSNAERVRIDSSGRVGIGTSSWDLNSVSTKLGVKFSGTTGDGIALLSLQNTANQYVAVGAQYDNNNTNNGSQIRFGIDSIGDTYSMIAFATANGGAPVERVRIDRLGNVGIGTSVPGAPLEVVAASSAGVSTVARFRHDNGADQHYLDVSVNPDTDTVKFISSGSANGSLVLGTQAVDTLTTTSAGNVGIGTSSPRSVLDVSGTSGITWIDGSNSTKGLLTVGTQGTSGGSLFVHTPSLNVNYGSGFAVDGSYSNPGGIGTSVVNLKALGVFSGGGYDSALTFHTSVNTTSSEKVRIDSSGNVGIGTTSPSYLLDLAGAGVGAGATQSLLQLRSASDASANSVEMLLTPLISGQTKTAIGAQRSGASSNAELYFAVAGSERARIDSSGKLLVGTSTARGNFKIGLTLYDAAQQLESGSQGFQSFVGGSPSAAGPYLILAHQRSGAVGGNTVLVSGDEMGTVSFHGGDGTNLVIGAAIRAEVDGTPGANDMPGRLVFSTTADGAASPTERMRITNGGNVLFNATAVVEQGLVLISYNGGLNQGAIFAESDTTSGNTAIRFKVAGSTVGSITTTSSATAYNTSSDYRLKENVTAVTDGITRLQQLKPSRFNFIVDPDHTVDGFIAHEVQDIVPEAITGEKDAEDDDGNPVYQGIDQSKMLPLVVAALQECVKRIESLESELALLKTKPYLGN